MKPRYTFEFLFPADQPHAMLAVSNEDRTVVFTFEVDRDAARAAAAVGTESPRAGHAETTQE